MSDPRGPISLCVEEINRAFMDATEFIQPIIEDATKRYKSPFRNLIPTGVFPLGEGLVQETRRYHGSMGDQSGLLTWREVQKGRAPGTLGVDDPGFDPCKYDVYKIKYGFSVRDFKIYETARGTEDICINDIKWNWQFEQQLKLIFDQLVDVTMNVHENFNQEMYLNFCRKIVWTDAADAVEFDYDPFVSKEIRLPLGTQVSTLTAKHFRYWYEMMMLDVESDALGADGDMPVFPFIIHPLDFDDMLNNDATIREDYRYANPTALVANYGTIKQWRGTGFMNHKLPPRFRLARVENGESVFERVDPFIEQQAGAMGVEMALNPEYIKAEYAVGMYMIDRVFEKLVPPAGPASPGGGTQFGDVPNLAGEWKWLVFPDRCDNPLGEKGHYFSRFQNAAKPLRNYDKPVAVFYKRCPQVCLNVCTPCVPAGAGAQDVVAGSVKAVDPKGTGAYTNVVLTLEAPLAGVSANKAVTVTFGDASTETAYIAKDANAPTYELTFDAKDDWVANGGGITKVTP